MASKRISRYLMYHSGNSVRVALLPLFLLSLWTTADSQQNFARPATGPQHFTEQQLHLPSLVEEQSKSPHERPLAKVVFLPASTGLARAWSQNGSVVTLPLDVVRLPSHLLYTQITSSGL